MAPPFLISHFSFKRGFPIKGQYVSRANPEPSNAQTHFPLSFLIIRNYSKVSDNVFRFSGRLKTEQWGEAHQVDERMPIEHLGVPVQFFKAFLKKYREK